MEPGALSALCTCLQKPGVELDFLDIDKLIYHKTMGLQIHFKATVRFSETGRLSNRIKKDILEVSSSLPHCKPSQRFSFNEFSLGSKGLRRRG